MPTGVFYSPGWDSWEEDLYVEIHIPSWMVDDGDWRSVFQQESRKEWSRTGLGSANAKNMPSSSRWNCSDIAAVEMVIAPYSFCTCSLYVLSTFSLVTPTLITSFPQGNLSGQNGFFSPTDLLIPGDRVRSQVYSVLITTPDSLLASRGLTLKCFINFNHNFLQV